MLMVVGWTRGRSHALERIERCQAVSRALGKGEGQGVASECGRGGICLRRMATVRSRESFVAASWVCGIDRGGGGICS